MKYSREEFLKALGAETIHEDFLECFEESMADYDKNGAAFLKDEFVDGIQSRYDFLDEKYDFVMKEIKRVRECDLYARYSFLLYKMLVRNGGMSRVTLKDLPAYKDVEERVDYEMAAYFAVLAFAPDMISYYEKRGLPKKIIRDTLEDCFQGTIKLRTVTHDRDGFDDKTYFSWNQLYTNFSINRIGPLNFEINSKLGRSVTVLTNGEGEYKILPVASKIANGGYISGTAGHTDEEFFADVTETDTEYIGYPVNTDLVLVEKKKQAFKKSEWKVAVKTGDAVISVHIPTGAPITPENCRTAYKECLEIVRKYFPEYDVKAIYCGTWLLDPQLADMLSEKSNIVNFGRQYMRFPISSQGRGVFSFLFRKPFKTLEDLPENTTLERAVKAHCIAGNYVYEASGFIFEDCL